MREKRIGSVTCGILMIMFGILFLVHMFYPPLSLRTIMKLWPLVLIALGSEMVAANRNREEGREEILKYDKGAVFLVFLLTCFAAGMGLLEYCMNFYAQYGVVYYYYLVIKRGRWAASRPLPGWNILRQILELSVLPPLSGNSDKIHCRNPLKSVMANCI